MRLWKGRDNRKEDNDNDSGTDDFEPDWYSDSDENILNMESEVYANLHAKNKRKRVKSKKKGRRCNRKKKKVDVEVDEDEMHEIEYLGIYDEEEKKTTSLWEVREQEHNRFIDENINEDTDLDNQNDFLIETAEPSSDLIIPLLRYQKEWLAWALKQENSAAKGGILADEMGMGKTIQAVALVLAKRKTDHEMDISKSFVSTSSSPSSSTDLPKLKCTLVVCPVAAMSQWKSEIDRFTTKGSTKVLVYHGAKRAKSLQQLSEFDFVITTYSVIESEYRNHLMPPKMKCNQCGRPCKKHRMDYHNRYICSAKGDRTENQTEQVKKEGKQKLQRLEKQDWKETDAEQNSLSKKLILHSFKWNRIILDEAHYIKAKQSNTAKGVFALESSYKWALSGTPFQNHVGELFSLVRFLQVSPYSFYLCKDCDCGILDYRPASACLVCSHKCARHFSWWKKFVADPILYGRNSIAKRAMILLKHKLLKSILLRRTKKGRAADLALPPRTVYLRRDTLDMKEEALYKSLYNNSQTQFNEYVQEGTLVNNYSHIFQLLTRLRQLVDHSYLVIHSDTAEAKTGSMVDTDHIEKRCGICEDSLQDAVVTSCEHVFCKECLVDHSLRQASCPTCDEPLAADLNSRMDTVDQNKKTSIKSSSILNRIDLKNFKTSTKIEALKEEIRFMVERDGAAKGIVFSQFTSFLDLINYSLQKAGVKCVQLVGGMSMAARDAAIAKFTDDADCKIFLVSLKAGGVALNLTVASHVFLMDPWWNPAMERQAEDRIHRIGQFKPIRVVRFIIENSIEERMLELQAKKELMFEETMGGSTEALGKLPSGDLSFLFS